AGFSATSASRLFWIMRNGASVSQDLQLSVLPRGAEILRDGSLRVDMDGDSLARRSSDYRTGARGSAATVDSRGSAARNRHRMRKRPAMPGVRSEEHTSELQSRENLVCRLL